MKENLEELLYFMLKYDISYIGLLKLVSLTNEINDTFLIENTYNKVKNGPYPISLVMDIAKEDALKEGCSCYNIKWEYKENKYIAYFIKNNEKFIYEYKPSDIEKIKANRSDFK